VSRSRLRELLELAGSSYLGKGFNAFSGPEPGRLHPGQITTHRRFDGSNVNARKRLIKMIKQLRKGTPAHELDPYGKSGTNKSRRSSDS
jgi:hypothetical protein